MLQIVANNTEVFLSSNYHVILSVKSVIINVCSLNLNYKTDGVKFITSREPQNIRRQVVKFTDSSIVPDM
jgi:fibrillarin-like rRNA methylase